MLLIVKFFSAFLYFLSLRCTLLSQHAILKRSPIYILPLEGQTMFYTHTRKNKYIGLYVLSFNF